MVCYSYPLSWSIIKISIRKVSRYPFFSFVARVIRLFGTPSLFGHLASYLRSFVFIEALPLYSHRCTNPGASPTRTPYKNTYFFLSRPDWSKAVSDRLKPRTRLQAWCRRALIKEDEDSDTPTSATTQPSNKWKFGTTTSTPVINGEWKETTSPRRRIGKTIIDLNCSNILTLILSPQREISFGYIDTLLRILNHYRQAASPYYSVWMIWINLNMFQTSIPTTHDFHGKVSVLSDLLLSHEKSLLPGLLR